MKKAYIRIVAVVALLALLLAGCSSAKNTSGKTYKKNVAISYYADTFNGNKTASGETFSNTKLTAAHRELPFGMKIRVTNVANNRSVIVTINDRGPQKKSRELDLSKRAFMEITDNKNQGTLRVNIEIVK